MKKVLIVISIIGLFLFSIQSSLALSTYVGVKILNLTDDPTASCSGQYTVDVDPYQQGRIRAISSILPDYPIYFNLSYSSNGSTVWAGNSNEDIDYTINDIIYLPNTIDMQTGIDYKLFLDIDAIRIYLPLPNINSFQATLDDNYWTIGLDGTTGEGEDIALSQANSCFYSGSGNHGSIIYRFIANNRSILSTYCESDGIPNNCDNIGKIGIIERSSGACCAYNANQDFYSFEKYNDLYTSNVGNINFAFTFN